MRRRTVCWVVGVGMLLGGSPGVSLAQPATSEDDVLDAMRASASISANDQDRIARWIERRLTNLTQAARQDADAAFKAFRNRMNTQFSNTANSGEFTRQFAAQAARVAQGRFAEADLNVTVGRALARVMTDMGSVETLPGLVACLKSRDDSAQFLCLRAMAAQKERLANDRDRFSQLLTALRDAGLAESSPVVLGRVYTVLAQPNHVEVAFDTFLELFDKRLSQRRGPAVAVDGAEIEAYEFFRSTGVVAALNNEQKTKLVARVAVFLRLDAERYQSPDLVYEEQTSTEHLLWAGEEILAAAVGQQGGIRRELEAGGHQNREGVLEEAYAWVGNAEGDVNGLLNQAPWNVPVGAP